MNASIIDLVAGGDIPPTFQREHIGGGLARLPKNRSSDEEMALKVPENYREIG